MMSLHTSSIDSFGIFAVFHRAFFSRRTDDHAGTDGLASGFLVPSSEGARGRRRLFAVRGHSDGVWRSISACLSSGRPSPWTVMPKVARLFQGRGLRDDALEEILVGDGLLLLLEHLPQVAPRLGRRRFRVQLVLLNCVWWWWWWWWISRAGSSPSSSSSSLSSSLFS